MRPYPLFLTAPFIAVLAGCGADTGGDTAFNPATDVNLVFSTFDLTDQEGGVENLKHTRFRDFYRGLQPLDDSNTEAKNLAVDMRALIDQLMGAVSTKTGNDYQSVRNPLDLINQVIASGEVQNFVAGRTYIGERIDAGTPATYNTRTNDAVIRFVDQTATNNNTPRPDREWQYQTLAWTYTPNDGDGNPGYEKVTRTIQYIARDDDSVDNGELPELVSLLSGSRFDATSFAITGYNQPELATVSFATRTLGSIEFRQDFVDGKTDSLFINIEVDKGESESPDEAETSLECLRVELDYPMATVRVYQSTGEQPQVENGDGELVDNPAYCGFQRQDHDEALIYTATNIDPARQ